MVALTGGISRCTRLKNGDIRRHGKTANYTKNSDEYPKEALDTFQTIRDHLNKGYVITAGCHDYSEYSETTKTGGKKKISKSGRMLRNGLFFGHRYTVIGAEEQNGKKYITVMDPLALGHREYKKDSNGKMHSKFKWRRQKDKDGKKEEVRGISKLELNNFMKYFDALDYEEDDNENTQKT